MRDLTMFGLGFLAGLASWIVAVAGVARLAEDMETDPYDSVRY